MRIVLFLILIIISNFTSDMPIENLDRFYVLSGQLMKVYPIKMNIKDYSNLLMFEYKLCKEIGIDSLFGYNLMKKMHESRGDHTLYIKNGVGENQITNICAKEYGFNRKDMKNPYFNSFVGIVCLRDNINATKNISRALIVYNLGLYGAKKIKFKSEYANLVLFHKAKVLEILKISGF